MTGEDMTKVLLDKIIELERENAQLRKENEWLTDEIEAIHEELKKHEKFMKKLYAMIHKVARETNVDLSYNKKK